MVRGIKKNQHLFNLRRHVHVRRAAVETAKPRRIEFAAIQTMSGWCADLREISIYLTCVGTCMFVELRILFAKLLLFASSRFVQILKQRYND
ncbi:MAG: hypothetical protein EAZ60_06235 [Oscillatoriales cyanobacterium]|nr:MAG: hypothetical protein EAZ83_17725 [Oscillatoriales cyanobacterium]TAF01219.1 MAG: hypothetical protein EAZ79_00505 [Oscillatoriales cyanobacterium]TAF21230.1 MAG: hypothetical protein EAZ73_09450 [Oscillatoriales cyanobacterium]TAF39470.1 MAG: hypothetical protein EAZ69_00980 [Oscillatoriales cyanobacterium]TAF57689.1 MAG: hypothetical protein EAZ60_06235 [Oscillatoriales cyanobacterium]